MVLDGVTLEKATRYVVGCLNSGDADRIDDLIERGSSRKVIRHAYVSFLRGCFGTPESPSNLPEANTYVCGAKVTTLAEFNLAITTFKECAIGWHPDLATMCAVRDWQATLGWLYGNGCHGDVDTTAEAAKRRRWCMVQWLRDPKRQCPWDTRVVYYARKNSDADMYEWLMAAKAPMPSKTRARLQRREECGMQ